MASHVALIHEDTESDYGVSFPDLPGCVTAGTDLGEAGTMAAEALALHLAGLAEDGDSVAEARSMDAVAGEAGDALARWVSALPSAACGR